jgi:hypothetical protein
MIASCYLRTLTEAGQLEAHFFMGEPSGHNYHIGGAWWRGRNGKGTYIYLSMADTLLAWQSCLLTEVLREV